MSIVGTAAGFELLFPLGLGLLGALLSLVSEFLIARFLPRLGGLRSKRSRITTAALTGALCAALALRIGMEWALPAFLVLGVLAVQLALIDLAHHLLPNPLVLALLVAGVLLLAAASFLGGDWGPLARAAAGGAVLFLVYLVLAVISPSGIGMGDVKLAAPVGLYLGYLGWSQLFYGGAFGFVLGGVAGVILLASHGNARNSEVALGPSMLAALIGTVLLAF